MAVRAAAAAAAEAPVAGGWWFIRESAIAAAMPTRPGEGCPLLLLPIPPVRPVPPVPPLTAAASPGECESCWSALASAALFPASALTFGSLLPCPRPANSNLWSPTIRLWSSTNIRTQLAFSVMEVVGPEAGEATTSDQPLKLWAPSPGSPLCAVKNVANRPTSVSWPPVSSVI